MKVLRLGLIVVAVIMAGLFTVYILLDPLDQACQLAKGDDPKVVCLRHTELALVLTIIVTAIVTLFGTLALPGAQDEKGNFLEQRIRFSIATTILVVYLLLFSMAVFWDSGINIPMVETLTNLMMVVIPFYFGASAAAQFAKNKEANERQDKGE